MASGARESIEWQAHFHQRSDTPVKVSQLKAIVIELFISNAP